MRVIDRLRRSAVGVSPQQTLLQAASIMDRAGVGALAVIDEGRMVGIVTDRDLVRRAMAQSFGLDARVDSVMSSPVISIDADADLHDAFVLVSTHGVRRIAVTRGGEFVGMISVDDLLIDLAQDLGALGRTVTAEVVFGHHDSPTPVVV